MLNKNTYVCPVCGYEHLDEPPYDEHGCSSFEICPCCGSEFGYDDHSATHDALRQKWKLSGMKWWSSVIVPPTNWDPVNQLKKIEGN